jgi:hypothetical protein
MLTSEMIKTAATIANMADAGGILQDADMYELQSQGIIPNDPTLCCAMNMELAWKYAGLLVDGITARDIRETLWG